MRIVIEQYPYEERALLDALKGFPRVPAANDNGQVRVDYVGYCYLSEINDCVFFLPKVVLQRHAEAPTQDKNTDKQKDEVTTYDWVFGKYKPESLLIVKEETLNDVERNFLYELSVWIYRAINEYKRLNPDSEIVAKQTVSQLDNSHNKVENTFIDILLSLVKFNEENQDFFMFIIKNIHSGYNKINWRKTISSQQPMMQDDAPIYMNPVNKKKQINFDEELLIIFFSILNYINEHFGFPVKINFNYELITGELFEQYRDFYGTIRLKQIKYKYFSDKALKLWQMCYDFFEQSQQISSSSNTIDYLLAYKFENIFEAIIDNLIGQRDLPKKLQEQKDGKIIDHLFLYSDLTHRPFGEESDIYYIGDSKYYKIGASIGENSIYKQYTYAKNVIQYDFDILWNKERSEDEAMYLDPLTEGYNITPNFFISADIKPPFSFDSDGLKPHLDGDGKPVRHLNKHFINRLFDRDTLWISHYDINFLFILALYGRGNEFAKTSFRDEARKEFRRAIIGVLKDQYEFAILEPREAYSLQRAVEINFKRLHGKIYCPLKGKDFLLLALEQDAAEENQRLKEEIKPYFYLHENFDLDQDVDALIETKRQARQKIVSYIFNENFVDLLVAAEPRATYGTPLIERVFNDSAIAQSTLMQEQQLSEDEVPERTPLEDEMVLVGYFNGDNHLKQILAQKIYYTRTGARPGSIHVVQGFDNCKYLFLHFKQKHLMFKLTGEAPRIFTASQLAERGFTMRHANESYLVYKLASTEPISFDDIELQNAIIRGIGNRTADSYFTTLKELFGL